LQPQRNRRPLSLIQRTKSIEGNKAHDSSNTNDDQQHQLRNRIIVIRTKTPIVHYPSHYSSSADEQTCRYNNDNSHPTSPNDTSSCISSLSVDDSHDYFVDLSNLVHISAPARTIYNNPNHHYHRRHDLEPVIHQIGEEKVGESVTTPHNHRFCKSKSPLRTLPSRRGENVDHQLTNRALRRPNIFSPESSVGEKIYTTGAAQSGGGELENRYSQHNPQGSVRSLDQNCLPAYLQKAISSTTVTNKRNIRHPRKRRNKRIHSPARYDNTYFGTKNRIYNSIKNYSTTTKNRHKMKKVLPRSESVLSLPTMSASTSFTTFSSTSMFLLQYGGHRQHTCYGNHVRNQSIGGRSNSTIRTNYGTIGKRRRKETKKKLKYLARKMIPTPLRQMNVFFMKKKNYDLKLSSGCLA